MVPTDDLAGARAATTGLLAELEVIDDDVLRAPSLLPGWSRAHVVAHLAGNALSHVRMLDGALAGKVRRQYAGDGGQREADIEALAARPDQVVAAHRAACAELDRRWPAMTTKHWSRLVHWLDGEPLPAHGQPWSRWKEVEVHHTDLGTDHLPVGWGPGVLDRVLADRGGRMAGPGVLLLADDDRRWALGAPPYAPVAGTTDALVLWVLGRTDGSALRPGDGRLPHLSEWR